MLTVCHYKWFGNIFHEARLSCYLNCVNDTECQRTEAILDFQKKKKNSKKGSVFFKKSMYGVILASAWVPTFLQLTCICYSSDIMNKISQSRDNNRYNLKHTSQFLILLINAALNGTESFPADIYLFKNNIRNTRTMCINCSFSDLRSETKGSTFESGC